MLSPVSFASGLQPPVSSLIFSFVADVHFWRHNSELANVGGSARDGATCGFISVRGRRACRGRHVRNLAPSGEIGTAGAQRGRRLAGGEMVGDMAFRVQVSEGNGEIGAAGRAFFPNLQPPVYGLQPYSAAISIHPYTNIFGGQFLVGCGKKLRGASCE